MSVVLRPTTAADLEFVLALEHHPDQRPYIGQWTREQHLDSIGRGDHEHWIIASASDDHPLGYLIAYDVQAAGYGIYIKRIALAEKSTGGRPRGSAAVSGARVHGSRCLVGLPGGARDTINTRAARVCGRLGSLFSSKPPTSGER